MKTVVCVDAADKKGYNMTHEQVECQRQSRKILRQMMFLLLRKLIDI